MADSKDPKDKLLKELNKISKGIDVEGLEFLIRQAKVLLHNMQINKVNAELRKLEEIDREIGNDESGRAAETNKRAVAVEEEGDNFILILGTSRKFLSRGEMRKIVHICQAVALETETEDSETEAALRLYRWFKTNRSDILADGEIANAHSPKLKELFKIVATNYRTKE